MRKFFVTLLILIILAVLVFFFGWVQLSVPPGAYGVISSKTHGIDPRLIIPGEFRWLWYKLIPTNVTISVFRIEPVQRSINANGSLPSGNIYSQFAGGDVDFSWEINASFSFTLKPDTLISVAEKNNIVSQEELTAYQQNLANEIESFIIHWLSSPAEADQLENFMTGVSQNLENKVLERFPWIDNFTCQVKNVRFPDFALYRQIRSLYEDFIAKQREITASSMSKKAEYRINSLLRLDELERYGELLTKYPILLEYLLKIQNPIAE